MDKVTVKLTKESNKKVFSFLSRSIAKQYVLENTLNEPIRNLIFHHFFKFAESTDVNLALLIEVMEIHVQHLNKQQQRQIHDFLALEKYNFTQLFILVSWINSKKDFDLSNMRQAMIKTGCCMDEKVQLLKSTRLAGMKQVLQALQKEPLLKLQPIIIAKECVLEQLAHTTQPLQVSEERLQVTIEPNPFVMAKATKPQQHEPVQVLIHLDLNLISEQPKVIHQCLQEVATTNNFEKLQQSQMQEQLGPLAEQQCPGSLTLGLYKELDDGKKNKSLLIAKALHTRAKELLIGDELEAVMEILTYIPPKVYLNDKRELIKFIQQSDKWQLLITIRTFKNQHSMSLQSIILAAELEKDDDGNYFTASMITKQYGKYCLVNTAFSPKVDRTTSTTFQSKNKQVTLDVSIVVKPQLQHLMVDFVDYPQQRLQQTKFDENFIQTYNVGHEASNILSEKKRQIANILLSQRPLTKLQSLSKKKFTYRQNKFGFYITYKRRLKTEMMLRSKDKKKRKRKIIVVQDEYYDTARIQTLTVYKRLNGNFWLQTTNFFFTPSEMMESTNKMDILFDTEIR